MSKNFALFYLFASLNISVLCAEPIRLLYFCTYFIFSSFPKSRPSISIDFSLEYKASRDIATLLVMPVFAVCDLVESLLVDL